MIPDDDDQTIQAPGSRSEDTGMRGFFASKAKEAEGYAASALDDQSRDTWLEIAEAFRSAARLARAKA